MMSNFMKKKTRPFAGFPASTDRVTDKQPSFQVVNFQMLGIGHLSFDSYVIVESRLPAAGKRSYLS